MCLVVITAHAIPAPQGLIGTFERAIERGVERGVARAAEHEIEREREIRGGGFRGNGNYDNVGNYGGNYGGRYGSGYNF